jgi:hypothetical protein
METIKAYDKDNNLLKPGIDYEVNGSTIKSYGKVERIVCDRINEFRPNRQQRRLMYK